MGKLSDDTLRFNLDINGDPARAEMTRLNNDTAKLKQTNKDLNVELQKMAANGKKNTQEYKNLQAQIKANNATIDQNSKKVTELRGTMKLEQLTLKELRQDYARLKQARDNAAPNSTAWKKANSEMQAYQKRMNEVSGSTKSANAVFGMLKQALPVLGVGALVTGLKGLKDRAEETRAVFSKYEAVLKNTLGSEKEMKKAFSELQKKATETPFSLDELTGSYVKLNNQGFKPTMQEMTKLGDLAASQGKSFDQLTEGVLDMMVGENERMKEFGLRAQKNGDTIKYTFKGVTTEVKNNRDEILKYVLSLGKLDGVAGSMEAISKTIGGAKSNFGDSMDAIYNAIGKRFEPALIKAYNSYGAFISRMAKAIEPQKEQVNLYKLQNTEVNNLFGTLQSANLSQAARNKLIDEINSKYGEYLPQLLTEKSTIEEIAAAQKRVNDQIRIKIISQAMQEEIIEALKREKEAVDAIVTSEISAATAQNQLLTETNATTVAQLEVQKNVAELNKSLGEGIVKNAKTTEETIKNKYKKIAEYYKIAYEEIEKAANTQTDPNSKTPEQIAEEEEKKKKEKEKADKEAFEKEKKTQEELLKLRKEYGLVKRAELLQLELEAFKNNEASKLLTAEEYAKAIGEIYKRNLIGPTGSIEAGEPDLSEFNKEQEAEIEAMIVFEDKKKEMYQKYHKLTADELQAQEMADLQAAYDAKLISETVFQEAKNEIDDRYREIRIEKDKQEYQKKLDQSINYASEMGAVLGKAIAGNELTAKEAAKQMALITLRTMKSIVQQNIIASTVSASAQSMAQPDSVATFGLAGIARAAIMVGLIEAVYAGIESKLTSKAKQLAKGKYNVIGEDDNRLYSNVGYTSKLSTGWVNNATLVGEQPEWVIDHSTAKNIEYRAPQIFDAINAMRVPQRATGRYPDMLPGTLGTDASGMAVVVNQFGQIVNQLQKGVPAYFGEKQTRDITAQQDLDASLLAKTKWRQ